MTASHGTRASTNATGDVAIIDSLRGLAAFAVMWFHFTQGNAAFLAAGWLKLARTYGYLGVDAFFAISGFVDPHSLVSGGYDVSLRNYVRFVAKRICRIDPPYLASVGVVIALGVASSYAPGSIPFTDRLPSSSSSIWSWAVCSGC